MLDFLLKERDGIWYGFFPKLEAMGFVHAFTCRLHGDSDLVPGNLNMALHVGDDHEKVLSNRTRLAQALGIEAARITTCEQVHGSEVVVVSADKIGSGALRQAEAIADTDALITSEKKAPLMLFFADCVPVMFADPETGAVGIAHAGWRGSVAGIAAKTVRRLVSEYGVKPQNLVAAIGPSIGPCCYEVDAVVHKQAENFLDCFKPSTPGHWQLDLWRMNKKQLLEQGLLPGNILCAEICTEHNKELFFSYRAEFGKTGRLAAVISRK